MKCLGPNAKDNATITEEFMLQRALENLEKMDVVGITEKLNRMIVQLKFHLGHIIFPSFQSWPEANEIPNNKKSTRDDESLRILQDWSWADQQLYKAASLVEERKYRQAQECIEGL